MSALRYCGLLRISVAYRDASDDYRCAISTGAANSRTCVIIVGGVKSPTYRVDSPEAFDAVAHAALSFAVDEDWPVEAYADTNEVGWHITRKP